MNDSSLCIETEFSIAQTNTQNFLFGVVVLYTVMVTLYVFVNS